MQDYLRKFCAYRMQLRKNIPKPLSAEAQLPAKINRPAELSRVRLKSAGGRCALNLSGSHIGHFRFGSRIEKVVHEQLA